MDWLCGYQDLKIPSAVEAVSNNTFFSDNTVIQRKTANILAILGY